MTKAELKNGMYVKLRNGMLELKIGDKLVEANGRYNGFLYYDKDLCHNLSSEWDIMEVFVSSSPDIFKTDALERIWERPNDKHVPEVGDLYVKNEDDDYSMSRRRISGPKRKNIRCLNLIRVEGLTYRRCRSKPCDTNQFHGKLRSCIVGPK